MSALVLALLVAVAPAQAEPPSGLPTDECAVPSGVAGNRPDSGDGPTTVSVGLYVIDITNIDDVAQAFTADVYLTAEWRDGRLSAERLGHSLAGCSLSLADLWHPYVDLINQRQLDRRSARLLVDRDGTVLYQQRFYGDLSAPLDLRQFPFDVQDLPINVASFRYGPEDVAFIAAGRFMGRREEFSVAGWSVGAGAASVTTEYLAPQDRDLSRLDLSMEARRESGYYVWRVLFPLGLIVLMASTVFWIDPTAFGPQVGVSTAAVLTLIAFQFRIGQILPRVSYLTRVDLFVLASTVLVFLALAQAVVTGRLAKAGHELRSRAIDRWSRWVYLTAFGLIVTTVMWY